ncbi:hypothetical protein CSA80_02265 [Candidatus Saccharibacteria bacterium]|nr:MAG: hypothetical protein CR973_02680 [Candidatus Saccharibacteria bacterium]PID99562.1 MAG: hypothetical protein CSA80_02265 [Candidatus Saccharibacteria bacterium]
MRAAVFALLDDLAVPYRLQEHEAMFTVAESSLKLPEKVPVKTLLITDEKKAHVWMVAMRGLNRLDMKDLARVLGVKKLQFVQRERVEELVGVPPGNVSVFGLLHPGAQNVYVILDASLTSEPELGFHPNDNTATVFLRPNDVIKVIESTGHEYRIMNI